MKKIVYILMIISSIVIASETLDIQDGRQMKVTDSGVTNMNDFNNATCIHSVWAYSNTETKWRVYSPNADYVTTTTADGSVDALSTIAPNEAFWVVTHDGVSCKITVNSSNYSYMESLEVPTGWSLHGSKRQFLGLETFDQSSISIVWTYDTVSSKWGAYSDNPLIIQKIFDNPDVSMITSIDEQEGFWIYTTDATFLTLPIVESEFLYNAQEGWGAENYYYNGKTETITNLSLPVGTYNIYVEIADGDERVKAAIGKLVDENGNDASGDIVGTGSLETLAISPANITIRNDSGADKTYLLPIAAKLVSNNNKVADNIHVAVTNATTTSYPKGGVLTLGDVNTNTLMMLGVDESHTWSFTAPSTGTYTLELTSDTSTNKLMQFNIELLKNSNASKLFEDSSEVGSYKQENLSLEAGVSYVVKVSTQVMQWDTIGEYTLKMIKDTESQTGNQNDTISKASVFDCSTLSSEHYSQNLTEIKTVLNDYNFTKCAMVSGVLIASSNTSTFTNMDQTALVQKTADIFSEILDNDQDGYIDDQSVANSLKDGNIWIPIYSDVNELNEDTIVTAMSNYLPNDMAIKHSWLQDTSDSNAEGLGAVRPITEEMIHTWQFYGLANAYPDTFGVSDENCNGQTSEGCNYTNSTVKQLAFEAMTVDSIWYQHPENQVPSNNIIDGTCATPSCAVVEFYHSLLVEYRDIYAYASNVAMPATTSDVTTKLQSTTKGVTMLNIMNDSAYHQLTNGLTFSYNPTQN